VQGCYADKSCSGDIIVLWDDLKAKEAAMYWMKTVRNMKPKWSSPEYELPIRE
jgi:hypothetical protein